MKKILAVILSLLSLAVLPSVVSANIAVGWQGTSTTQGTIFPTPVNGVNQSILVGTTSASYIGNFAKVLDASQFPGADIGAKLNAAYAALPTTGGRITIPSGLWVYTTPVVFGTNGKEVYISCASGGGASNNFLGGTILDYTPSTGDAFTINTGQYVTGGSGMENCDIEGSNGTSARTTNGITLGGTNGAFQWVGTSITIAGFGTGFHLYQNTSFDTLINPTIDFNGRNIFIESTSGANGENFKVFGGTIADSNNQAGGATDLYCINNQLSGNTQVSFIGTSIDDCQYYDNQFGGTANITNFTDVHWENPNQHTYDYISTLANVPSTEINITGGDMMNDVVGGMPEFVSNGGDITFIAFTVNGNSDVVTPVTRLVTSSASASTVSWKGLTNNGKGATYIYGTSLMSEEGYGTGLSLGPTFNVGYPTATANGTTTIANLGGVLDATTFAGADIGAKVNAAYASAAGKKGISIFIPNGVYSFSTPIVFGVDGRRGLLWGSPAEGVELDYTGTGCAITLNDGDQGVGIDHTSGNGLRDLYLRGSSYSTTSPQIGVCMGGSQGIDGGVLQNVNIFHFGYGIESRANTYHSMFQNGTIRDNGQNVHIDAASNSGESIAFTNAFIVDGANHDPFDCIWMDNSATASFTMTGGSADDCQIHILQANNVSMTGVHLENVGASAWGSYPYIVIDNNLATNVGLNNVVFFNTASPAPSVFVQNGGNVIMNGVIVRQFTGSTVTNFMTLSGSGRVSWLGFNNVSGTAVTNIVPGYLVPVNGSTGSTTLAMLTMLGAITSTATASNVLPYASSTAITVSGTSYLLGQVGIGGVTNPASQLDISGQSWIDQNGVMMAYSSTTNQDTVFGALAGGNVATTSATVAKNTAIGYQSMYLAGAGANNTAVGHQTMFRLTTGGQNAALGTGSLLNLTNGNQNTALGYFAGLTIGSGSNNTCVGAFSCDLVSTGGQNTFIGEATGSTTATGSGNIMIGYDLALPVNNGSNQLNIGGLIFGTGLSSQSSSTPSGLIGIGTTTPVAALTILGSAASSTPLFLDQTTGTGGCVMVKDTGGVNTFTEIYTRAGVVFGKVATPPYTLCN